MAPTSKIYLDCDFFFGIRCFSRHVRHRRRRQGPENELRGELIKPAPGGGQHTDKRFEKKEHFLKRLGQKQIYFTQNIKYNVFHTIQISVVRFKLAHFLFCGRGRIFATVINKYNISPLRNCRVSRCSVQSIRILLLQQCEQIKN